MNDELPPPRGGKWAAMAGDMIDRITAAQAPCAIPKDFIVRVTDVLILDDDEVDGLRVAPDGAGSAAGYHDLLAHCVGGE